MFSGTDLIRNSGQIHERAQLLKAVEDVPAVESPAQSNSNLDEDTQSALLRFARFINKEGGRKKQGPKKAAAKGLPKAYQTQIEASAPDQRSGGILNIRA